MDKRVSPGGVAFSELGLGTAQFGNLFQVTTEEESAATVDAAWDIGIRYFDTAPHYGLGLAEVRLGRALRSRPRDEFVLSTKVGRVLEPQPEAGDLMDDQGFIVPATTRRRWDFSRDGILRSFEDSLRRLNTDRIDVLYLHDPDDHWEEASTSGVGALIELRDQGVVQAIGAGMNQATMLAEFVRRCDVDVVMCANRYTLVDRAAEDELLPLAQERKVAVVSAAVYNSGLLSRAVVRDDVHYEYGAAPSNILDQARAMSAICENAGVSLPDAAVQFGLRHPAVVSVVLGLRTPSQVAESLLRLTTPIPPTVWDELDRVRLAA